MMRGHATVNGDGGRDAEETIKCRSMNMHGSNNL
jgi:hypothetical protein